MKVIYFGRRSNQQKILDEYLQSMSEDERSKVVVIKSTDKKEELRGNRLPLIIDWDMEMIEEARRHHED